MSLQNGNNKMSKSDKNDKTRINLGDGEETIRMKIRKAKTDSIAGIETDNEKRPEAKNLTTMMRCVSRGIEMGMIFVVVCVGERTDGRGNKGERERKSDVFGFDRNS